MIHLPGWRNIPSARTLSIMIVFAGIGLIVSIISLLNLSQHLIGLKANEIDKHRSMLSMDGAVQTTVNCVLSLVMDNSIRDDAVHQTYANRLARRVVIAAAPAAGLTAYWAASASSLSRKPVTEMARLSARQRSFGPGAELCTAITCQPSGVFSSSGEPLSPGKVSH